MQADDEANNDLRIHQALSALIVKLPKGCACKASPRLWLIFCGPAAAIGICATAVAHEKFYKIFSNCQSKEIRAMATKKKATKKATKKSGEENCKEGIEEDG